MNSPVSQSDYKVPQVLLIEDEPLQAALIRKKLEKNAFRVVCCNNVTDGLQLLQERSFAVAIVDLELPGKSGLDFVRGVAVNRSKTKIILHSIDSSFRVVKEGLNLGVFAFVEKGRIDDQLLDFCAKAASAYLSDNLDAAKEEIVFQLSLLGAVAHGIIATDPQGKVVYWNRFSEKLTGVSESSTVGRSIFDFITLQPHDRHLMELQIRDGGNWVGECRLIRIRGRDQDSIPARVAISVLKGSRGVAIGSVISLHDLSEIRSNERRLELRAKLLSVHSELGSLAVEVSSRDAFLCVVLEKLNDALSLQAGRIVLLSRSQDSENVVGRIGEDVASIADQVVWSDVGSLERQERIEGVAMPLVENGETIGRMELVLQSPIGFDHEQKVFLKSVSALVDGFLLRHWATHLWRSLFESSLDSILIMNAQGQFIDANWKACDLLGYARDEFSELSLAALDPDPSSKADNGLMHKLFDSPKQQGEIVLAHRNKSNKLVEYCSVANIVPGIHITHVRDITERIRSERLIAEQKDQLAHVQRTAAMGQMAAVLAHEINQPLGAICNFAGGLIYGLAQSAITPSELTETLNRINDECLRAGVIISRLRKFLSREPLNIQRVELTPIILDTQKILANLFSNSHVDLRCELAEKPIYVAVDPIQIQQVLVNVLKNSVEALQANPDRTRTIQIATESINKGAMVLIEDNGPPISDSEFSQLFKPYHSTKATGLGMGLCISQTIIEQHGGSLEMSRIHPQGMKTCIWLPAPS